MDESQKTSWFCITAVPEGEYYTLREEIVRAFERVYFWNLLVKHNGSLSPAGREAGINDPRNFRRKLAEHDGLLAQRAAQFPESVIQPRQSAGARD